VLISPKDIEQAAEDIVKYWETSDLPSKDKAKILEMVKDYYESKNEYLHDQYLGGLASRVISKHIPETGFESD